MVFVLGYWRSFFLKDNGQKTMLISFGFQNALRHVGYRIFKKKLTDIGFLTL